MNPYTPPKADIADAVAPAGRRKRLFVGAPRALVVLLSTVVAALLLQATFFWKERSLGVSFSLLVAVFSCSALFGSRKAATFLRFLFCVVATLTLVVNHGTTRIDLNTARVTGITSLLFGTAIYMSVSQAVAAFYRPKSVGISNGG